jgi:hypothetical protein
VCGGGISARDEIPEGSPPKIPHPRPRIGRGREVPEELLALPKKDPERRTRDKNDDDHDPVRGRDGREEGEEEEEGEEGEEDDQYREVDSHGCQEL